MKPQSLQMLKNNPKVERTDLHTLVSDTDSTDQLFHMHASRAGPLNANEIYLALNEKKKRPNVKRIIGLLQPNGSVSKFLNYWLAGLDTETSEEILSQIKLNNKHIYHNHNLDEKVLNAIAQNVVGNWKELVEALVQPLVENYRDILAKCGYDLNDFQGLKESKPNIPLSLEESMIDISQAIVNHLLQKHGLPDYQIKRFNPLTFNGLNIKYVSRVRLQEEYEKLILKKKRQYKNAYSIIATQLKSYGGRFPRKNQLKKVFERCSRIDPSFNELKILPEEVKYHFEHPMEKNEISLHYTEQIHLSILAYKKAIQSKSDEEGSIIYVDGKNMIRALFEIAERRKKTLILQEFIRGGDYQIYKQLLQDYQNLNVGISSCRIWDIKKFPEFDQNFVKGLEYLVRKK